MANAINSLSLALGRLFLRRRNRSLVSLSSTIFSSQLALDTSPFRESLPRAWICVNFICSLFHRLFRGGVYGKITHSTIGVAEGEGECMHQHTRPRIPSALLRTYFESQFLMSRDLCSELFCDYALVAPFAFFGVTTLTSRFSANSAFASAARSSMLSLVSAAISRPLS